MLGDMAKKGQFTYSGRNNQAEARFASGECAMLTSSTGAQANIRRLAAGKFEWSVNFIPYHDDVKGAPQNSIIGGASLWVLSGRTPADYNGVAVLRLPVSPRSDLTPAGLRADHHAGLRKRAPRATTTKFAPTSREAAPTS
jgi:hypothetical protein